MGGGRGGDRGDKRRHPPRSIPSGRVVDFLISARAGGSLRRGLSGFKKDYSATVSSLSSGKVLWFRPPVWSNDEKKKVVEERC
jgi:hypothetical protein